MNNLHAARAFLAWKYPLVPAREGRWDAITEALERQGYSPEFVVWGIPEWKCEQLWRALCALNEPSQYRARK